MCENYFSSWHYSPIRDLASCQFSFMQAACRIKQSQGVSALTARRTRRGHKSSNLQLHRPYLLIPWCPMYVFRDSGTVCYRRDYILSADESETGTWCALFSAVKLHSDQRCLHLLSVTTSGQNVDCGSSDFLQSCC
jgi:hypothetical protein